MSDKLELGFYMTRKHGRINEVAQLKKDGFWLTQWSDWFQESEDFEWIGEKVKGLDSDYMEAKRKENKANLRALLDAHLQVKDTNG